MTSATALLPRASQITVRQTTRRIISLLSGAVPVNAEPLQVFVSSHYPAQSRFPLLLEML
ncbi:hypothetical protein F9K91_09875 [Brucella tritici]|uniref:Uncharacterized protein n=1 Tax=Brucella tritici TaxID=94626 RepID=A0A833CMU0_9HYPH|nr:hypothetical protein F9K91_09875 [Brucella tritici]